MFKSNAKKNELKEQLAAENMEKQGRPTLPSLSLQAASSLLLPCSVLHHISYLKIMMMITDYDCDDKKTCAAPLLESEADNLFISCCK